MFRVISECFNITVFAALCVQFARGDGLTFHIGPGCLRVLGNLEHIGLRICKQTQQLADGGKISGTFYFHSGKSFLYTKTKWSSLSVA